ncbi:pulmonary surfactant-associated protein A2-like [Hyperolius riggenbachi]|uniref:pulmonary surfactant-associated protein A2-like n=1 Tax=Hyperolius riggenbachi TaxID=752182 RepID=UPI0035A38EA8
MQLGLLSGVLLLVVALVSPATCLNEDYKSFRTALHDLQYELKNIRNALAFIEKVTTAGNKIFASHGVQATYDEALQICANAGGSLAAPENHAQNEAVWSIVKKYGVSAFLGIDELKTEGVYRYHQIGEAITYSNWNQGEPNNFQGNDEDCAEMPLANEGLWNDQLCDSKYLVICQF